MREGVYVRDIGLRLRDAHRANINAAGTDSILGFRFFECSTLMRAHKFAHHTESNKIATAFGNYQLTD